MKTYAVHVCSFEAVEVKPKTTYRELRKAVLKAGRFSVFDATATKRAARLFSRLVEDPRLEVTVLGFPWTAVRRKEPKP